MSNLAKLKDRARAFEQKSQWREAVQAYTALMQQSEGADVDLGIWNRIGDLHQRLGEPEAAVSAYERAADAYAADGFHNNAIALCNKILRIAPDRVAVHLKLGRVSAAKGFWADARQSFLAYAESMQKRGSIDASLDALTEFVDLFPDDDDSDIRLMLAEQLRARGRTEEAVHQLRVLLGQLPRHGRVEEAPGVEAIIRSIDPEADVSPLSEPSRGDGDALPQPGGSAGVSGLELHAAFDLPAPEASDEGPAEPLSGFESTSAAGATDDSGDAAVDDGLIEIESTSFGDFAGAFDDQEASAGEEGEVEPLPLLGMEGPDGQEEDSGDVGLGEITFILPDPVEEDGEDDEDVEPLPFLLDPEPTAEEPEPAEEMDQPERTEDLVAELPGEMEQHEQPDEQEQPDELAPVEPVGAVGPVDQEQEQQEEPVELDRLEHPEPLDEREPQAEVDRFEHPEHPEQQAQQEEPAELDRLEHPEMLDEREPQGEPAAEPAVGLHELDPFGEALPPGEAAPLAELEPLPLVGAPAAEPEAPAPDAPTPAGSAEVGAPEDEAALRERLRALAASGDYGAAVHAARALRVLRPDDVLVGQKEVEFAFKTGDRQLLVEAYLALAAQFTAAGQEPKARAAYQRILQVDPEHLEARAALAPPAPPQPAPRPGGDAPPEPEGGYVDLGALIFEDDDAPGGEGTRFVVEEEEPTGDEDRDFADMLARFRQKVSENIGAEDTSSHYDLGLAFKEMGLLDEAISHFQIALQGGARPLATLEVMAECFIEKGQWAVAQRVLERALAIPGSAESDQIGVYYLLGRCMEARGDREAAAGYYERVLSLDIGFRDAPQRIEKLRQGAV